MKLKEKQQVYLFEGNKVIIIGHDRDFILIYPLNECETLFKVNQNEINNCGVDKKYLGKPRICTRMMTLTKL